MNLLIAAYRQTSDVDHAVAKSWLMNWASDDWLLVVDVTAFDGTDCLYPAQSSFR